MLEARDITVRYDSRVAVSEVSLKVQPGEIIAVIGPNGAGKSTLLRTLNGGLRPASGAVVLDEKPLREYSRRFIARRIAVVAQEADVRFPVTVLEFVLGGRYAWAGSAAWGWESRHDLEYAHNALRETDLEQLSGRFLNELSGGERQRAVLARALATGAGHLLLDEPTANLDLAHQATILALVRNRCDQGQAAAVVVTHDVNLAAEFADYILLMKGGSTLAFGRPSQVLTPEQLGKAFNITVLVDVHPISGMPRITPVHEIRRD
ncbi:MAG: ABC transporter ATP-binding protein [Pyrinomonadaceae bacterium]